MFLWKKNSQLAVNLPFVFISSDSWATHSRKLRPLLGRTLYGFGGQHASGTFTSGHQRSVYPSWLNIFFSALPNTKRKKPINVTFEGLFSVFIGEKTVLSQIKLKCAPCTSFFRCLGKECGLTFTAQGSSRQLWESNLQPSPCSHAHTNTRTCMHARTHAHINV